MLWGKPNFLEGAKITILQRIEKEKKKNQKFFQKRLKENLKTSLLPDSDIAWKGYILTLADGGRMGVFTPKITERIAIKIKKESLSLA
ncbi:MAG: hypothetical protein PUC32_01155 [Oscillospiraceae bacterium]|nr:hypothetical protein [Oscillospiraceae bacterium]